MDKSDDTSYACPLYAHITEALIIKPNKINNISKANVQYRTPNYYYMDTCNGKQLRTFPFCHSTEYEPRQDIGDR